MRNAIIATMAVIAVFAYGIYAQRHELAAAQAKGNTQWEETLAQERRDIALKLDDGERHLRERANKAQEAILAEYVQTYCADHSGESSGERQMAMTLEATLSRLAIQSGVDRIALAEYNKCKPVPELKPIEPHRLKFPPNWKQ
jgi:hypothetical protein